MGLAPAIICVVYSFILLVALLSRRGSHMVDRLAEACFNLTSPLPMPVRAIVTGLVGGIVISCFTSVPILIVMWLW